MSAIREDLWGWVGFFAVIGTCLFGIRACNQSDWYQADLRTGEAQRQAARQPHLFSEGHGCQIFSFNDGGTHYFATCKDGVTTERNYTEPCGKGCTAHKSEIITTRKQ